MMEPTERQLATRPPLSWVRIVGGVIVLLAAWAAAAMCVIIWALISNGSRDEVQAEEYGESVMSWLPLAAAWVLVIGGPLLALRTARGRWF